MQSTQKVNELIDIMEKMCDNSCDNDESRGIAGLELNKDITFNYHKSLGLVMFYDGVWHTDEDRIDAVVEVPSMRKKLIQLVNEDVVKLTDIERMAFELS